MMDRAVPTEQDCSQSTGRGDERKKPWDSIQRNEIMFQLPSKQENAK